MRRVRLQLTIICILMLAVTGVAYASTGQTGTRAWPYRTLQLGMADEPGDAGALRASAPFGLRYQYLSAGVNTGRSWQTWGAGNGSYVTDYISESEANNIVPVFSYYQIRQSLPGASISDEATADLSNLADRATMLAYYQDLKTFFERAATAHGPVVLQVEPDLWGYIEQRARGGNASTVPAAVASSGMADLRGMPNTAAGFAQAVLVLRHNYAPKVIVGYPISIFGTGKDIHASDPSSAEVDTMAAQSAEFYRSLHARYDALFTEVADRDAGYAQAVNGDGPAAWWNATDFARDVRYLHDIHFLVRLPIVLWQIPLGNTVMRAMNNTPYHYQDNRVQYLLGDGRESRTLERAYVNAGVVALLFGSGQATGTCACDAAHDGVTNPAPIDGNARRSLNSDDDGGYFRSVAAHYYHAGALTLP